MTDKDQSGPPLPRPAHPTDTPLPSSSSLCLSLSRATLSQSRELSQ